MTTLDITTLTAEQWLGLIGSPITLTITQIDEPTSFAVGTLFGVTRDGDEIEVLLQGSTRPMTFPLSALEVPGSQIEIGFDERFVYLVE